MNLNGSQLLASFVERRKMKGFSSVLWILFVIVLKKCDSIETGTFVDLSRTRRQALDQSDLPENYTIFPDHNVAYKIYNEVRPWDAARGICKSDGGDLAIADTVDKIRFIQDLDLSKDNWLFVGIYKPAGSARWKTVEEAELSPASIPWASWDPVPDEVQEIEDCAAIALSEIALTLTLCDPTNYFVCEISTREYQGVAEVTTTTTPETTTLTSTLPPPPPPPPPPSLPLPKIAITSRISANSNYLDGYIEFSDFHTAYKIHDEHLTHYEARRKCFSEGGRLAVVDSFKKINVISKILDEESVHVGIRVSSANLEEWVVDSDGKPLKDLPWTRDNPCLAKCAALKKDGSGLEETLCSYQLHYLCEIPKNTE